MADWVDPLDDSLIPCSYCGAKTAKRRYLAHVQRCSKKKHDELAKEGVRFLKCPFNPTHHVQIEEIDEHIIRCPDAKNRVRHMANTGDFSLAEFKPIQPQNSNLSGVPGWEKETNKNEQSVWNRQKNIDKLLKQVREDPFLPIDNVLRQQLEPAERALLDQTVSDLQKDHIFKGLEDQILKDPFSVLEDQGLEFKRFEHLKRKQVQLQGVEIGTDKDAAYKKIINQLKKTPLMPLYIEILKQFTQKQQNYLTELQNRLEREFHRQNHMQSKK